VSGTATLASLPPAAYLLATTAVALVAHQNRCRVLPRTPGTRFAVCIPAHDEQAVVTATIEALVRQDYPRHLYDVHLVADNCTDRTVELASGAGATVHERVAPDQPGKGPALNWLHDRLDPDAYDAVVVVDADTIAEPGFLAALDAAFAAGATAVQGHYGVREPGQTDAVALRYAALACRHHLRPLARTYVGASCGLYGNGMAFRTTLLRDRRWSGHLVEDAEFQLDLLLDGVRVTYVPAARVAAEMPTTLASSATQHERWELGRLQLLQTYGRRLLRRTASGGPLPRHVYADSLIDLVTPPLSLLAALDALAVIGSAAAGLLRPSPARRTIAVAAAACGAILGAHVITALQLDGAPRSVYRSLLRTPTLIAWKLALLTRIMRRPDDVRWIRTTRTGPLVEA
jgi:cellulose synthase/poly-beta-1,6-N-acetylglucosamine synthase-like glycosyltransferase